LLRKSRNRSKVFFESNFCGCYCDSCRNSSGSEHPRMRSQGSAPGRGLQYRAGRADLALAATLLPGTRAATRATASLAANPACKVQQRACAVSTGIDNGWHSQTTSFTKHAGEKKSSLTEGKQHQVRPRLAPRLICKS